METIQSYLNGLAATQ